jgi:hypothetical protein
MNSSGAVVVKSINIAPYFSLKTLLARTAIVFIASHVVQPRRASRTTASIKEQPHYERKARSVAQDARF